MKSNTIVKKVPYEFEGKTYQLQATFIIEAKIYEKWGGSIGDALKGQSALVNMVTLLTWMLNDCIESWNDEDGGNRKLFTENYVGRHLPLDSAAETFQKIADVFKLSRPESDGEELTDEERKN